MVYNGITQPLPTSAFGDIATTSASPRIQLQFPYNINYAEVSVSVTNSGTVYHSQPFAVCSVTVANSSAQFSSLNNLHYRTGQGGLADFTAIYTLGTTGSTQLVGLGDTRDGFFIGYNATVFSINRRDNGADSWIPQSSWNADPLNGTGSSLMTLDPTKGNVYRIQYQWLGFGSINFFIENPITASFFLIHRIQYPNAFTVTSVFNPSLPLTVYAANTTNASPILLKVPSMAAFVEGTLINTGLLNSALNNSKAGVTTAGTAVLTIKNKPVFNGITNRKFVQPLRISLAVTTNDRDCLFNLTLNPTLGGTPSYTDISTNTSVVSYDVAGTTVTGGRVLATFYVDAGLSDTIDITDLNIILNTADILTISAATLTGDDNSTVRASIVWNEQF